MGITVRPAQDSDLIWAGSYTWHNRNGGQAPGVALLSYLRVVQHLTAEQALNLADQLVDAAEASTRGAPPINAHHQKHTNNQS